MSLKDYITKSYQIIGNGIKHLTHLMKIDSELNNGETKIYILKGNNNTIVKCNTIFENKKIYIGDYSMCK